MTKIVDCAHRQTSGAGSNGAWRSVDTTAPHSRICVRDIFHYGTCMMSFITNNDGEWDGKEIYSHIGRGSVSDQMGMNKLFREMNMPYYYQRQGGARIRRIVG